jgi:hypothetical protein
MLAPAAGASLGKVVVIGDSMASGTRLGPQVPGSILACGQSTGSYPELAKTRVKYGSWTNVTCNGGHAGVFANAWTGMPADPAHYQYNDGTTIPPQYNSITSTTDVVIVGSGGNEAYYGEVMQYCMGHSDDYNANRCRSTYGADGAGLVAKTNNSKTLIAGVLDTVHTKAPNAKVFLIGTPRVAPPDGIGCWPNPILTLADAPVWSVWEDSLRTAMMSDVAARSSWAKFVDLQTVSGNSHTMCAPPTMRWMNPWTVENITYPGLALHNTPWGADATADALVKAFKSAGLSTETPDPPALLRTSPTAATTSSTTQVFSYSGTSGFTFKCRLDNAAYAACPSSPVTLTGLAGGSHTYSVTQTDGTGKVSPAATVDWTIDSTAPAAPTVTRTSPNTSPTNSGSQTISYVGAESGGSFECKLDGAAYSACQPSPVTLNGLASGTHNFYVRQLDDAGNTGAVKSVTWVVDVTPPGAPTVTRTTPSASQTNSTTQALTYSGAESGGTYQCKLDSANWSACSSSPVTLTGLSAGTHTYSVTQTDAVGNVGSATSVTWTIDTTPPDAPTVVRTSPTATPTNSASQTLTYSGAESGGSYKCKLDAAAWASCGASPVSVSGLASGSHTYSVTQTDDAGNTSTAGTVGWTVDVTPPPAPIVSGPSGTTPLTTASISYSDAESGVTFECKLDAGAYAPCPPSPVGLSGLAIGPHSYSVTATDATGNVSAAGVANWTVDPSGFTVSITSGPNNPSGSANAAFVFSASVTTGTTFECKLDAGAFTSCTSAKNYSALADGSHTFTVHAINGGQFTPDVVRTWMIDTTAPGAPTLARTSPTASLTNSTSQTFSLSAAESGGVLSCKLDSAAPTTCPSSPITIAGLADGAHTFSATQTDAAGNTGSAAAVTWTVDATPPAPPSIARTGPTAPLTNSKSQTIAYGGLEPGATPLCKLDAGNYGACQASPFTLSGLPEGSHTVLITQTDTAGNVSQAGSVSWSVDSIAPGAPSLQRTSPTASPSNQSSQEFFIGGAESGGSYQCKLDAAPAVSCAAGSYTVTGLTDGSHSLAVTQTDPTGNVSSATAVAWVVDTVAPAKPGLGFSRPAKTNMTSVTIEITPAEPGGTLQCAEDFTGWTTCPSNIIELTGLLDGNHNFAIRQVDAAGNLGAGAQVSWLVDTVAPAAPTLTRSSPSANPTNATSQTITFAGDELEATLSCKLDGDAWGACPSSPLTLSGLANGSHTFSIKQRDPATNESPVGSVSWTVDNIAPLMPTVTRSTSALTTSTAQTISYNPAEVGGTLLCKLDDAEYSTCAGSPVNLSELGNGPHSYSVKQIDAAGNTSPVGSVNWTVDNVAPLAPTVNRTSPAADPTNSTSQAISYSGEPGGSFECKLDAGSYGACQGSPVTIPGFSNGTHSYSVRQTDSAGNKGPAGSVSWTVDNIAPATPTVMRTTPTANPTISKSQTISFSGEPGATFRCRLDDAAFAACAASPLTLGGLADGDHSYEVIQTDAAGNSSPAGIVTWTIGNGPPPPTVSRVTWTADPSNSRSQAISYSGIPGGRFACKLDTGPFFDPCNASPISLTELADGQHTIFVRQYDDEGNPSPLSSVTWTVDATAPAAPTVTRIDPVEDPTTRTTQTLSYSGEPGGEFECKLDSASYGPCPGSPFVVSGIGSGRHVYSVRQVDAAGNVSAPGSASWTIPGGDDAPPPTPPTSALSTASLSSVLPRTIRPARRGGVLSTKKKGSAGSFRVTLSRPTTVSLRLERIAGGKRRSATTWTKLKLKSGSTRIYLSGRARGRALKPGSYRIHLIYSRASSEALSASASNTDVFSAPFKIKR